ncbi:unnamed protein product [Mortierella alpina]
MKFSIRLVGLTSLITFALVDPQLKTATTTTAQNAVTLLFGFLEPFGKLGMCLTAIASGVQKEVDIALQSCDQNPAQLWKFNRLQATIQLADANLGRDQPQCLVVYQKPPHFYPLTVTDCNSTAIEQQFEMMTDNTIISSKFPYYCLDAPAFDYNPGSRLRMFKRNHGRNQQWMTSSA